MTIPLELAPLYDQRFVDALKAEGLVTEARVEAALRAVPRRWFLPGVPLEQVYRNEVVITKRQADGQAISSASQPGLVALMLEQLQVTPGQRILEVGAGTGYNAALLQHLVGLNGHVVTVDIDADIVAQAQRNLLAAKCAEVQVILGDGFAGYAPGAPYDRIILTAGAPDLAPAWLAQLRPGGRLLVPLALYGWLQLVTAFEQRAGAWVSQWILPTHFMMLRGTMGRDGAEVALDQARTLKLTVAETQSLDAPALLAALAGPADSTPTGLRLTLQEMELGLNPWLALHEPGFCLLRAEANAPLAAQIPGLLHAGPTRAPVVVGLADGAQICLLAAQHPPLTLKDSTPLDLVLHTYAQSTPLAQRLLAQLQAWVKAQRPQVDTLHITVYPTGTQPQPEPGETLLPKAWNQWGVRWEVES